jgi:pimeloyl-ACP methyl ester carboxylesterase
MPFGDRFRLDLEDLKAPLSSNMACDSRTLLLAFGGMAGQLQIPPFEFFALTGEMPVKRLFVRDLHQAWYHRGIPGYGSTIEEVAESLRQLIARHDVDRLVVAGVSAGGYAALVFGALLSADRALCFAPQTTVDQDILAAMDDHRWDDRLELLTSSGSLDSGWTDLRDALPAARCADTHYDLYFDESFDPDRVHSERLAGLDGVRLHHVAEGEHEIARKMRETGELEQVLRSALGVSPQDGKEATLRK